MTFDIPDNQPITPMCSEVVDHCWTKKVSPELVHRHIRDVVDAKIAVTQMKPGKARDSVMSLLIENEYRYSLDEHLLLIISKIDRGEIELEDRENTEDRIDELRSVHAGRWGDDGDEALYEEDLVADIDKPVQAGGLTKLMVAAQSGTLDEVIELVEIEAADPQVRCNGKMTAYQRARDLGRFEIADYLEQYESTDELAQTA